MSDTATVISPEETVTNEIDFSDPEIQARLERGYQQVLRREGTPIDEVREESSNGIDFSDPEISARLERGYQQAMRGEGRPMDEVFDDLERKCRQWMNTQ